MKKNFKRTALIAIGVLVCTSLVACKHFSNAHPDSEKLIKMVETHIDDVLDTIDVTEEQRGKINQITDEITADAKQVRSKHLKERGKIIACILLDEPNRDWLHGQVEERSKAWTEFSHRSVDRLIEISAVLSPEQREELKERFASAHGTGE